MILTQKANPTAIVSSIFWVFGFVLSVVIAPQLRIWTWGPSMLCFALSLAAAIPALWNEKPALADIAITLCGLLVVAWIVLRSTFSPVLELAQSDLLLVSMAVATFLSFRAIIQCKYASTILTYGIALLLLASAIVICLQVKDAKFSPVFPNSADKYPAGFFAHYNYGASFLIPTSLITLAIAVHSRSGLSITPLPQPLH